jgi:hypothetical protein
MKQHPDSENAENGIRSGTRDISGMREATVGCMRQDPDRERI